MKKIKLFFTHVNFVKVFSFLKCSTIYNFLLWKNIYIFKHFVIWIFIIAPIFWDI